MSNGWGDGERSGRFAGLLALGGAADRGCVALLLASAAGEPYLGADGVNGWLVVFAAGLLAALIAFPFGIELRLRERHPDRDRRWEVSLLVWGGVAIASWRSRILTGFDTGTLAGAAALIAAIEAGLVIATIGVWLVSGG